MRGETRLTYNGITLTNCQIRRFHQEAVYDASGTDIEYHRFSVSVTGFVSEGVASVGVLVSGATRVGTNAASQQTEIRSALLKARQTFELITGYNTDTATGATLLSCKAMPSDVARPSQSFAYDVNNGPKPQSCDVTAVAGSTAMRVEFEIEIAKVECNATGHAPNNSAGVLSHRWSCSDTIDEDFYTTRTFTGRLVTVGGSINPHELRNWVVPRLTIGFRRQSMNFRVTEDGRALEYTVTDREIAFSAPRPATSWDFTYREKTGDGKMIYGSVDIYLGGPRDVVKAKLVEIAYAIFKSRLMTAGNGRVADHEAIVEDIEVTDHYGENDNSIRFSATVRRTPTNAKLTFGTIAENLGQPITKDELASVVPDYDFNVSRGGYQDEPVFVTGPIPIVGAFKAYLQSPCDDQHRMIEAVAVDEPEEKDDSEVEPDLDARIVTKLQDTDPDRLSSDHRADPYTVWEVDSKYQTDDHRVALPVAGQINASNGAAVAAPAAVGDADDVLIVAALARPTVRRIMRIRGQRVGKYPEFPEPKRQYAFLGGIAKRLRHVVTPEDPRRTADGKDIFTSTMELEYVLTKKPTDDTDRPIGRNPWEDPAFADRTTDRLIGNREP